MKVTCRPVEPKDIALICSFPQSEEELFYLFPKAATYPLSETELKSAVSQRAESTVIECDGKVVGFANFYRFEVEGICSIGNVVISPEYRGRGLATFLIKHMNKMAFATYRASEVTVSCFNENVAGLLFYPRLGFLPYAVEERRSKRGDRVALIHFKLEQAQITCR